MQARMVASFAVSFGAAVLVAAPTLAAPDLVALRAFFDRADAVYRPDESADLVLAYLTRGEASMVRDVLVDVEIGTVRARYRLREARVPQSEHHFHMTLALAGSGLEPGTYPVTVHLDSGDAVTESDETNNTAQTTLILAADGMREVPAPEPRTASHARVREAFTRTGEAAAARTWEEPLEAGFHPGYGSGEVVLHFDNPALAAGFRPAEQAVLHLVAEAYGDPFASLGTLEVAVRPLPGAGATCLPAEPVRYSMRRFSGAAELDIPGAVLSPAALRNRPECLTSVEVKLSFPRPAGPAPRRGSFLRVSREGTWLGTSGGAL